MDTTPNDGTSQNRKSNERRKKIVSKCGIWVIWCACGIRKYGTFVCNILVWYKGQCRPLYGCVRHCASFEWGFNIEIPFFCLLSRNSMRIWPKLDLTQIQSANSCNWLMNSREKTFFFQLRVQCECNEVNLPVISNRNMLSTRTEKKKDGRPSYIGSIGELTPFMSEKY